MADTDQIIDDGAAQGPLRSRRLVTLLVAAGLVLAEGAGIFIVTRTIYRKPASAGAADLSPTAQALEAAKDQVELPLPEVNAFNKREGRLFLYNLDVTVVVHKDRADDVQKVLDMRKSAILDRLNTVIRSADIKYLNEPGLDTLRRQFRFELDKVIGDEEVIVDLLIPRFYQSPADL